MIKDAVDLTWKMVMLVPPALVDLPKEYSTELMNWNACYWNDDACQDPVIYFKPVMFYSSLGHVAERGVVGNIRQKSMKLIECKWNLFIDIYTFTIYETFCCKGNSLRKASKVETTCAHNRDFLV